MIINGYRYLTEIEEEIMELFWASDKPLTSVEISKASAGRSWNGNYVHKMLRSLLKKGLLEVCGTLQYGTQYARQFQPTLTKESYAAQVVLAKGRNKDFVAKVAVALAQESSNQDELIEKLEEIIEQLRNQEECEE